MPAPATASPDHQLALLELQRVDTALDQARARMQQLRQDPEYQQLRSVAAARQQEAEQAAGQHAVAEKSLAEAEQRTADTRDHRDRNQKRLDAGQGSPKDLEHMMHEIQTLDRLIGDHEEEELEAMDAVEQAAAADEGARAQLAEAEQAAAARAVAVKQEAAEVSARGKQLTAERQQRAGALPEDLVALYEKIRARSGTGAARLVGNRSEASGMHLSPVDLDQITKAPADQLVFCPDTGAILVRGAE